MRIVISPCSKLTFAQLILKVWETQQWGSYSLTSCRRPVHEWSVQLPRAQRRGIVFPRGCAPAHRGGCAKRGVSSVPAHPSQVNENPLTTLHKLRDRDGISLLLRWYDMNGRSQMQGRKNWLLSKEINANRFLWDSHRLEIWKNHLCPSMRPNEGSVTMYYGV
jgi:hypothetical protein